MIVKELDEKLIKRANDASFIFEQGDRIVRSYSHDLATIESLSLSFEEKQEAINKAYELRTAELCAYAKAVSPMVSGRANLNVDKTRKNADKALHEGTIADTFISSLKDQDKKIKAQALAKSTLEAFQEAERRGLKEFIFNNQFYQKARTNWNTWDLDFKYVFNADKKAKLQSAASKAIAL